MAVFKVGVGRRHKAESRQSQYIGCVMHKTNKTMRYHYADTIDNIDFYVSGHTHQPTDIPAAKLVVDDKNNKITFKPVERITAASCVKYGGYAIANAYRPASEKVYKLVLDGQRKRIQTVGFYL